MTLFSSIVNLWERIVETQKILENQEFRGETKCCLKRSIYREFQKVLWNLGSQSWVPKFFRGRNFFFKYPVWRWIHRGDTKNLGSQISAEVWTIKLLIGTSSKTFLGVVQFTKEQCLFRKLFYHSRRIEQSNNEWKCKKEKHNRT